MNATPMRPAPLPLAAQFLPATTNAQINMRIVTLTSSLLPALFAAGQWQPTGNPNAQIQSIATQGDTVVAGTAGSGVYFSYDAADSWSDPGAWSNGIEYPYIQTLMIEGNEVYAGAHSGLYRSTFGNTQWESISNGLDGGPSSMVVFDILRDGGYLFTALATGVFRSDNNGALWTLASTGLTGGARCLLRHGPYLLAGTSGTGVFRSTNNGDSWTEANNGLTAGNVQDLISVGGDLFLASTMGIFRSTDDGDTWAPLNSGLLNTNVSSLLAVNGQLLAGTYGGGVYRSTNNGTSWSTMNSGLTNTVMTSIAMNDTYVYVGNSSNGAVDGDVWRETVSMFTGIAEHADAWPLRLYPSPTTGTVTLDDPGPLTEKRHVLVRDHLGRIVQEFSLGTSARTEVDLDVPPGSYTLEVQTRSGRRALLKVVKVH